MTVEAAVALSAIVVVLALCLAGIGCLIAALRATDAAMVLRGEQVACARAESVTAANHAVVTECALDGADVLLTVSVSVRLALLHATATARARAGPVVSTGP